MRFDRRHEAQLAIERLNGNVPEASSGPLTVRFAKFFAGLDSEQASFFAGTLGTVSSDSASILAGIQDPLRTTINTYPISLAETSAYEFKPLQSMATVQSPNIPSIPNVGHPTNTPELAQIKTTPINQMAFYQTQIANTIGWRICARNLPPDAQETLLWELFGPFGAVLNVRIVHTYTNYTLKCQESVGYVTMSMIDDVNKAIFALDGFRMGNRSLQVYLAHNHELF